MIDNTALGTWLLELVIGLGFVVLVFILAAVALNFQDARRERRKIFDYVFKHRPF